MMVWEMHHKEDNLFLKWIKDKKYFEGLEIYSSKFYKNEEHNSIAIENLLTQDINYRL